jgi:hypothetical protein
MISNKNIHTISQLETKLKSNYNIKIRFKSIKLVYIHNKM